MWMQDRIEMPPTSEFTQSFFDASSKAWKKNKVKYDQACYTYVNDAFKGQEEAPVHRVSAAVKRKNTIELQKRQGFVEEAPLPVRRSPRLYEQHLRETYAYP
jgi:hypothetical protein